MKTKNKKLTGICACVLSLIFTGCGNNTTDTSSQPVESTSSDSSSSLHSHTLSHVDRKEATCEEKGNTEYWYCDECFSYFSDEGAANEISYEDTVIEALGHSWDTSDIEWTWSNDCSMAAATFTCLNDEEHTETIEATVSQAVVDHDPTCTEEGMKTYTATVTFEGNQYTDTKSEPIDALGHTLVHTQAVDATCTEVGNTEYWYCEVCEKYFSDEGCTNQILLSDTVINAKGHDYDTDNIEWTWSGYESATAVITCKNDSNHKESIEASVSDAVIDYDATCEETGLKTYTASITFNGNEYTNTKSEVIDALGHDWDTSNVAWTWEGYEKAIAAFTCKLDDTHIHTETATITNEVTTDAACETSGIRTYTASVTFNNVEYTNEKTEVIDPTGHDWDTTNIAWEWTGYDSNVAK